MDKDKKILITSALVYSNGSLHLGHLLEYIQTDIFVRYLKLKEKNVVYFCADDAHGTPIEINARKQNITPIELVEKSYKEHIKDFKKYLIEFDEYYITESKENKQYADELFKIAKSKELIYKKEITQLFCDNCNRFLPDRYVKGICSKCNASEQYGDICEKCGNTHKPTELLEPKCALCESIPKEKKTQHYFFKLSAFSKQLKEWLNSNKNLQPEIINSVKKWIDEGLEDWDISRDSPYFGFKILNEDNLYYYVWWDAPIGYISTTEKYCNDNNLGDAKLNYWQNNNTDIIHFIGKDIIYFHFLFWPAMLITAEYNLPKDIVVHGFITINNQKMSKSKNTFITAKEFAKNNSPEHLRFYFSRMLSKKVSDVDYNKESFISKINNELIANISNFCYRSLSFSYNNFDGKLNNNITKNTKLNEKIKELKIEIKKLTNEINNSYEEINFKKATEKMLLISDIGNKFFQSNKPWDLIKEDKKETENVLFFCLELVKILAITIKPILPKFSKKIENILNLEELLWKNIDFENEKFIVNKPEILIKKIEKDNKEKLQVNEKNEKLPLNLVVGKIINAKEHENAEKLLILKIDIGEEKRQVVAGLKEYYKPEELINKKIILVKNLDYAKIRDIESQGMVLAADDKKNVKIIELKNSEIGDKIFLNSIDELNEEKINFKKFSKEKIIVKDKKIFYKNDFLKTKNEIINIDMEDNSKIR
ncbi:MAG: methionine--tRNA ligase [Candidatus Woesearchaeota archaeon]